ncbi:XRE family transcriptional regulator [Mycolicibacterium thermoresistibile]
MTAELHRTADLRGTRPDSGEPRQRPSNSPAARRRPGMEDRPVEFWPTSAIRAALENDELPVWQRIVAAIKRDPYGRTARQVEEVIETTHPYGVSKALDEVLLRAREALEQTERAEVAQHVRLLLERSGLGPREFASRIGATGKEFAGYLEGSVSPPASLMIRMRRLSDRFAKMRDQRPKSSG